MVEETVFTIGVDAIATDGVCGEVTRVVVDPVARAVTHLVVEPKHRRGLGRLVPLDLVDATTGEVRIRCTMKEFEKLAYAEETHFLPGIGATSGYGAGMCCPGPTTASAPGASRAPSPMTRFRWARWPCAAESRFMPPTAGSVGSRRSSSIRATTT